MSQIEREVRTGIQAKTRNQLRELLDECAIQARKLMEMKGPWDMNHKYMYLWWCAMVLDGRTYEDGFYAEKREHANDKIWFPAIEAKFARVVRSERARLLADPGRGEGD